MLDFAKVTDFLAGMTGNLLDAGSAQSSNLMDLLTGAGLDPSALTGMSATEVMDLLQEHGIDSTQLVPEELMALLNSLGVADNGSTPQEFFAEDENV